MGLLDQLWDDTVAGPCPDSGLGKLRKYASFSPSSSASVAAAAPSPTAEGAAAGSSAPPPAVTRSITMLRPAALSVITSPRSESSSAPSSPSPASGAPDSPFGAATTPKGEGWKKLRRKGRMADGADAPGTPRSPTVYDW
ncbi:unnamed protein product [Miscanthus lutarioriparius]|uniref:Uncharacterized protein n=1 Tax=Miscanthus lutarioriparius TaxID=422564 RepID=A0A811N792_9POAL|nr:unnamed protein product [Miscanthus lutarioriparius]